MKTLSSLQELKNSPLSKFPLGLTIGNFDGVHLGHQYLLKQVQRDCQQQNRKFAVLTFVPHPQKILSPEKQHFLLNSYLERRELIAAWKPDFLIELDFTKELSTLSPKEFLDQYIFLDSLALDELYLGYDFSLGSKKAGDFDFIKSYSAEKKVQASLQKEFQIDGLTVSSTKIRSSIEQGNLPEANKLLGRDYFLSGLVMKSLGRGRQIGFPTANLSLDLDRLIPQNGVYATKTVCRGKTYHSLTNIGYTPTFKSDKSLSIETHILDFQLDIYGELIEVSFIKKLRDELKFPTVNDLVRQIHGDIESCQKYFNV